MAKRGILTVLSGFSGAGKDTVKNALLNQYPDTYAVSVSATTRDPRPEEKEGEDYFFVEEEEFRNMISRGEFYEYAVYQNHYYGTPRSYVDQKLSEGKDVILIIEVQGGRQIKERFPDSVLVFLTPPSAEELKKRLKGRQTEKSSEINGRLQRAAEEAEVIKSYDYILVNDDVESCARRLHGIIQAEHLKTSRNESLIDTISNELKQTGKEE